MNRVIVCMGILCVLFTSACSIPFTLHKDIARSGAEQPSSEKCRECHTVIYDEWKGSAHSRAFTNEFFRSMTNGYRVNACVNCHAPQSAFSTEMKLRPSNRQEGVNCQTCHLLDGKLQGPVEKHIPFDIHPIVEKNEKYLKSSLCGHCHAKAYEEYLASGEKGRTCQNCHMPEVKRTIIDNKPWVWLKDNYTFRRHSFDIRESSELADSVGLEITIKENPQLSGAVTVRNISVPHSIPTGGYGYHEIVISIALLDEKGLVLKKTSYSMTEEMKTSLKKGETRSIPFEFTDTNGRAVLVRLVKTDPEGKEVRVLAETLKEFGISIL